MMAAAHGYNRTLELLHLHGADLLAANNEGVSVSMFAVLGCSVACLEVCRSQGGTLHAILSQTSIDGDTVETLASNSGVAKLQDWARQWCNQVQRKPKSRAWSLTHGH